MKRLALTMVALASFGAATAEAETLKVSTFLPPNHVWNRAIEAWGTEIADLSGGELDLEIFPAGQLGPPPRQYDLVRTGAADLAVILHSATPGRFPMTELAGLPLTGEARSELDHYMHENPRGKHGRIVYDLEGDFGIQPESLRERFSFYYERFPVEVEARNRG